QFVGIGANISGPGTATAMYVRPRNVAVMWCIKAWNAPINQGNIDVAALASLAAQATEVNQGTAKVATNVQMLDSANDAVIATPKKLRLGFAMSLAANGYVVFPSWLGGLVVQWGFVPKPSAAAVQVTWPMAFPNAFGRCSASFGGSSAPSGGVSTGSPSKEGASFYSAVGGGGYDISYIAIGW
ncbi:gp53-like domain-containing protein, partial [Pseudomonas protegens]